MDNHKRTMIRQWVENQSYQSSLNQVVLSAPPVQYKQYYLSQVSSKSSQIEDKVSGEANQEVPGHATEHSHDVQSEKSASNVSENPPVSNGNMENEEEDPDSGPSEVPPALPLIEPLSARDISHESVHTSCSNHVSRENLSLNEQNVAMMDCGLQVNEDDIAKAMGW
jgi:kinesin family protein 26